MEHALIGRMARAERLERLMKILHVIGGIVVSLIGMLLRWYFVDDVYGLFKGVIGLTVLLIGVFIIVLSWPD